MNYIEEYTDIVFQELPDHISLAISIAGCGHKCKGCHSPIMQDATNGRELTDEIFRQYLDRYKGCISAVIFFSGALYPIELIPKLKEARKYGLKTALYTGFDTIDENLAKYLDYLKTGHYDEKLGALDSPTTNQKMIDLNTGEDITYKFNRKIGANYETN